MTLKEMREILARDDIRLTKSLGQNFLHDGNQLRRIVASAKLAPTDKVLEIGPGLGPLTELLVAEAGEVLAVEKDARLAGFLREKFAGEKKITLIQADALEWLKKNPRDWGGWKLVSNLPYSVGSPIFVELAAAPVPPDQLVATFQLEVVRRLIAQPGDDDYGLLTLLVQLRYEPGDHFKIPPGCFFPPPNVDSACVTMVRRSEPLLPRESHRAYEKIVRRAFSQRRKMMVKLLKSEWPEDLIVSVLDDLGISRLTRAEALSVAQFAEITKRMTAG